MISSFNAVLTSTALVVTLVTNGVTTVGSLTNRDVISSSAASSISIVNYDYWDAFGHYCPIITSSGTYIIKQGVWGYELYITQPGTVIAPSGFVYNSLANIETTNLQTLIAAGGSPSVFSTFDLVHTNFIANPSFWLSGKYQISGMIAAEGLPAGALTGQECGCAVSPMHVLVCWHAPYSVGQNLFWCDINGVMVERQVSAITTNFVTGSDIEVCLLNAALPASVIPLPLLPVGYGPYLPAITNSSLVPVVCGNQGRVMTPKVATVNTSPLVEAQIIFNQYWFPSNWGAPVAGGDSGSPICLVVGTNLVLVSHWHTDISGPWYPNWETQINQAMHFLSTNNAVGTDYQLTSVDLSPYPTF